MEYTGVKVLNYAFAFHRDWFEMIFWFFRTDNFYGSLFSGTMFLTNWKLSVFFGYFFLIMHQLHLNCIHTILILNRTVSWRPTLVFISADRCLTCDIFDHSQKSFDSFNFISIRKFFNSEQMTGTCWLTFFWQILSFCRAKKFERNLPQVSYWRNKTWMYKDQLSVRKGSKYSFLFFKKAHSVGSSNIEVRSLGTLSLFTQPYMSINRQSYQIIQSFRFWKSQGQVGSKPLTQR